jgi:hypothetical protein
MFTVLIMSRLNQIKYWAMAILVLACHLQLTQAKLMFAIKGITRAILNH